MNKRGLFLVFEGGEGSGKSIQAQKLKEYLEQRGHPVLLTKEPGGDDGICRDIRACLLNPAYHGRFSPRAEFMLFEADRAQHVDFVILPALREGKIVICDRFEASSFAYQCGARKICGRGDFHDLNSYATGRLNPDFTFWIDINPEVGLKRNVAVQKRDRFEAEAIDFHRSVRIGYEDYFSQFVPSGSWNKFDGVLEVDQIHAQILSVMREKFLY